MNNTQKQRARRAAHRVGLRASLSRQGFSMNNMGGFMLSDANNMVVVGARYDLSPEDVVQYCQEHAA